MTSLQPGEFDAGSAPDANIVAAVLAGDRDAFRVLVERYHRPARAYARNHLGDGDLADDASQEAFIEAFRSLGNLREPEKFRYWLFGILRHRCLKARAAAGPPTVPYETLEEFPGDFPDPTVASGGSILDHFARLNQEDRQLLAARYVQQLSYTEIGEALRITCGAVRVRCLRARERLRRIIVMEQATDRDAARFDQASVGTIHR